VIRVLVDTNVIISALLFPNSTPARVLARVLDEHRLVLTDWIISELHEVVGRKRPDLLDSLDEFLAGIDYELASPGPTSVPISDPADQPILDAAVTGAVDFIVTGDKAFLALGLDRPRILTARAFLEGNPGTD
jgi:putative PIN family toxin of toxin-antitoxin system